MCSESTGKDGHLYKPTVNANAAKVRLMDPVRGVTHNTNYGSAHFTYQGTASRLIFTGHGLPTMPWYVCSTSIICVMSRVLVVSCPNPDKDLMSRNVFFGPSGSPFPNSEDTLFLFEFPIQYYNIP